MRDKISNIRFLLVCLVVLVHAHNLSLSFRDTSLKIPVGSWIWFIEEYFSNGLAKSAVPLFFCISGYLYFDSFEASIRGYWLKLKSRVRSIGIPYLLWSGLALSSVILAQHFHLLGAMFHNVPLRELGSLDLLEIWVLHPLPSQLWFLHNLMALVITAPLTYLLLRFGGASYIALLAMLWILFPGTDGVQMRSIFCFTVGAYFTTLPRIRVSVAQLIGISTFWIFGTALRVCIDANGFITPDRYRIPLALAGAATVWFGYDYLSFGVRNRLVRIANYSFFIFLAHEPLQGTLIKGALLYFGTSYAAHASLYLVSPIVSGYLCFVAAQYLSKRAPKFYSILVGGRSTVNTNAGCHPAKAPLLSDPAALYSFPQLAEKFGPSAVRPQLYPNGREYVKRPSVGNLPLV